MAAGPAPTWRYVSGLVAGLALVVSGGSIVWASHAPAGAALRPGGRGLAALVGLRGLQSHGEPVGLALAQRYDPMARLARTGLPDVVDSDAASVPAPPAQTFEQLTPQQAAQSNASLPFSTLPNPPARPFRLPAGAANDRARALTCLTMAVYYEAASESDEGQAAVAQVVLNRVRHPLFPKSVCAVVFQGSTLPTGCQFTFTCDGSLGRRPSQAGWTRAQRIAARALDGFVLKTVGEATHYHTQWVVPYWRPTLVKETQIGAHIFYRWMGGSGTPAAFNGQYAGFEPPPPPIPGFDTGPTTVLVARQDAAPAVAAVAQIETPKAQREALAQVAAAPLNAPPVEAPPPSPVAAPPAPPAPPVYFGKPFRQNRRPAPPATS